MSDETVRTICWCVVFVFAIQGCTFYCLTRLMVMGKPLFERKEHTPERSARLIGLDGR